MKFFRLSLKYLLHMFIYFHFLSRIHTFGSILTFYIYFHTHKLPTYANNTTEIIMVYKNPSKIQNK